MANSAQHSLKYVAETQYGVTPTSPTFKELRQTGSTLALTKDALISDEQNSNRQIRSARHGARIVGGDVSSELFYGDLDDLLEAALGGTWQSDTPQTGTDELTAGTTRRSFSIQRYFGGLQTADKPYHMATGCEVQSMALTISANALVTVAFTMIGQDYQPAETEPSGSITTAATLVESFTGLFGTINENGSPIGTVTEISLTVDNGEEARNVVGTDLTLQPKIGRSNVTGTLTAYFENSSLLEKFINETVTSVDFSLIDPDGNELKIELPHVKYTGGNVDASGEDSILLALPFQAYADPLTDNNIIIERTPIV
jgi:hypothetical protein